MLVGGKARSRRAVAAKLGVTLALTIAMLGALASTATAAGSVTVRVEGAARTIYSGTAPLSAITLVDSDGDSHVLAGTALGSLAWASQMGAFPYVAENMSFGLYYSSIGGETELLSDPWPGWMYRVNGASPSVGASQYVLKAGDDVLWYYGTYTAAPIATSVPAYAAAGATATVIAQQLDSNGAPSILPTATVYVGSAVASAGVDGAAGFWMARPGNYGVRAEKDGFVRSKISTLKVRYSTSFSSLSASKSSVRKRAKVTLSAKLRGVGKTPSKRTIRLSARRTGSSTWKVLAKKTSTTNGTAVFTVRPTRSMYYRFTFADDGQFAPATSSSRLVKVR